MEILRYLKRSYNRRLSISMLIIILMSVLIAGCGSEKKTGPVAGNSFMPPKKTTASNPQNENGNNIFTGVLINLDKDSRQMHFTDVESGDEVKIDYTGGTDIKNKYNTVISATQMESGEVFKVTKNRDGKVLSIYEDGGAWEVTGATGFSVDEPKKTASFGGKDYNYQDQVVVFSGENRITPDQIMKQDIVTIRGNGDQIYSVMVQKGHGYLKLTGYQAFMGGYADVGTKLVLPVTQNMVITAPEGDYKVSLQLGNLQAAKTVKIERDKDATLDFSEYRQEEAKTGMVLFSVTPSEAVMYLDGTQVDYSKEIQLTYGSHKIVLKANYYSTYSETFVVNSAYEKKIYDMVQSSAGSNSSNTASSSAITKSSTQGSGTAGTKAGSDSNAAGNQTAGYMVNIKEPEGAAVYVDSIYVGIAPVSFSKSPGNKVVTFSKSGKDTKSYTISVPNAAGNMDYAFPDM